VSIITQYNDLSAYWVRDSCRCSDVLLTEINSGVSELCWVDVEVTGDVCTVAHFSNVKFLGIADMTVAIVDDVGHITRLDVVNSTPFNNRFINVTFTSQCHIRALYHCRVQRTANQFGFYNYTRITILSVVSAVCDVWTGYFVDSPFCVFFFFVVCYRFRWIKMYIQSPVHTVPEMWDCLTTVRLSHKSGTVLLLWDSLTFVSQKWDCTVAEESETVPQKWDCCTKVSLLWDSLTVVQ